MVCMFGCVDRLLRVMCLRLAVPRPELTACLPACLPTALEFIGGGDDTDAAARSGKLPQLLKAAGVPLLEG